MKKIIPISLFLILAYSLYFGSITYNASSEALKIWFETLVPSLFIGLVLIRVLDEQGAIKALSNFLFFWVQPVFNISPSAFSLVFASFFLGSPAGGMLIDDYVKAGQISAKQGQRFINCVTLATPSFIILTCGVVLLNSIFLGFLIWISQILACLILLLLTRSQPINIQTLKQSSRLSLFESIRKSIMNAGISLFYVGGYLIISVVLLSLLTTFLPVNLADIIKSIGEFALGCTIISKHAFSPMLQALLICALIGFSGFSVHLQVISLAPHTHNPYGKFLLYRLFQAVLATSFLLILLLLLP